MPRAPIDTLTGGMSAQGVCLARRTGLKLVVKFEIAPEGGVSAQNIDKTHAVPFASLD